MVSPLYTLKRVGTAPLGKMPISATHLEDMSPLFDPYTAALGCGHTHLLDIYMYIQYMVYGNCTCYAVVLKCTCNIIHADTKGKPDY